VTLIRHNLVERLEAADEPLQASSKGCPAPSDPAGRRYMACECGRRMLLGGGEAEAWYKFSKVSALVHILYKSHGIECF